MGLAAVMLAATLLHAAGGLEAPVPPPEPVRAGTSSPSASTPVGVLDLSGKVVDPFEMAAGKPVVFIFVRTDCPISNRYAPTIQCAEP